jgi:hypothetical protein
MVRVSLVALGLVGASGCSLLLDFSPGAIPKDAAPDAPYSQDECDYKEPNEAPAQAAVLTRADTGPAAICAGDPADVDYYRFTVPAGTTKVSVRVTFTSGPTGDLDLKILDLSGATTLGQSRGFEDEELVVCPGSSPACPTLAAGDYLFEVFAGSPGSVNRYELALTLTP